MRGLRYVVFFLLFIGVGCTTPSATIALIEQSERVAIDYPDSALMLIESVDRESVRGKHDNARYRLVYSEVLYYNRIDSDCDSLTRPLFDYYYDSDNHAERARAMYQHGLVMMNAKRNAEAMYALMESEKSLQHCDNPRLFGMVYSTMGDIYGIECIYRNALNAYMCAHDVFNTLSLEYHSIYSLFNIAEIHISLREYDVAEQYLITVLETSKEIGYNELYCYAADVLCKLYVYTSHYDKIEKYVDIIDNCDLYEGFDILLNCYKAVVYSYYENRVQALRYLDIADTCANPNAIEIEYIKSIVYQNLGDNASANYWLQQNKIQQEELLLGILELPILNTQIDLLKRDIDIARERAQYVKYRNIFVFLLLLIIAITIALYIRHRMIMQRHEIEKYVSMISELKLNYENSSSVILSEVQAVYGKKLSDLNNLLETYYEHGNTSRESYKIVEQVKSIVESIRRDGESMLQLERLVNLHHNNIVVSIKSSGVRFSEKELRYIVYMLSGFSNRSMCLLLDIDDAALYRIKYKVKNKMIEAGLDNEIIKMLLRR